MKAIVKATGNIIRVELSHYIGDVAWYIDKFTNQYAETDLEFIDEPRDYWTCLEHQYAGMAMQGYIIAQHICQVSFCENDVELCKSMAHALVEKLKETGR